MELPIKIIDFVSLLFLSLLVVIIVFIILQRNIKRFKLRRFSDPHFLSCKSIPNELKDAILRKHSKSHVYTEPALLLTSNYQNLPDDKAKSFIIRMKAFEVSKNLENALYDIGFMRPSSIKFEEFIDNLISQNESNLPNDLLKEFSKLYLWAMLDPMKFDMEQLRKLNRFINSIIESLASKNPSLNERILQHLLEIDNLGDVDFNKRFTNTQNKSAKLKYDSVQPSCSFNIEKMNFSSINNNNNNNNNNNIKSSEENINSKSSKIKTQASKLAKSVFNSRKNSLDHQSNNSNDLSTKTKSSNSLVKEKVISSSKYEEIKDNSYDSQISSSEQNNNLKSPFANDLETLENDQTNRWSINNESMKAFDSENEEIPLVSKKQITSQINHQKKKSNHSITTVTHAQSGIVTTSKTNETILSNVNKKLVGEENEGFSQTFETNF